MGAPLTLTVDELRAFPAEQIGTFTLKKEVEGRGRPTTVRGLLMIFERDGQALASQPDTSACMGSHHLWQDERG